MYMIAGLLLSPHRMAEEAVLSLRSMHFCTLIRIQGELGGLGEGKVGTSLSDLGPFLT